MDTVERKVFVGFFGSLAVLAGLAFITYLKGSDFIVRSRELYRVHNVLIKLDQVVKHVADASSREARFLRSGSVKDLEACQDSIFSVDQLVGEIHRLSARQSDQLQRLQQFEPLVAAQVKLLATAIHWRQSAGPMAAARHLDSQQARKALQGLGSLLEDFKARETALMDALSDDLERKSIEVSRAAALSALACVLIFAFVHWLIHAEMARRHAAESSLERQTTILSSVLNGMGDAVVVYASDGRAIVANPAAQRLLGALAVTLTPETLEADGFLQEDGAAPFPFDQLPAVQALAGSDGSHRTLRLARGGRGQDLFFSASARSFRDPQGGLRGAMAIYHDISAIKHEELAMLEAKAHLEDRVESLSRHSQDMRVSASLNEALQHCIVREDVCHAVSESLQELFAGSQGVIYLFDPQTEALQPQIQWGYRSVLGPVTTGACRAMAAAEAHVGRLGQGGHCDHVHGEPAQTLCVPLDIPGAPRGLLSIALADPDPQFLGPGRLRLVGALALQASMALGQMAQQEVLRNRLIRDPLTGLYNRRHLDEVFVDQLGEAQRHGKPLAIFMTDIDHFKRFNDTFGHAAGDLVLRQVASAIGGSLGPADRLFRFGGEEFTALLPGADLATAMRAAERARHAVEGLKLVHQGRDLGQLSISLGVSGYPETSAEFGELLRQADAALYEAKNSGRNCSHCWHLPKEHAA